MEPQDFIFEISNSGACQTESPSQSCAAPEPTSASLARSLGACMMPSVVIRAPCRVTAGLMARWNPVPPPVSQKPGCIDADLVALIWINLDDNRLGDCPLTINVTKS